MRNPLLIPLVRVMALAVAAILAAPAGHAFEIKMFDAETFKAAQAAGKPVLVDVSAPWCPVCKAQHKIFEALKAKPELFNLTILQADFDTQKDALKGFNVQKQGTLIAFKGAVETGRTVGDTDANSIEALMASTLR